MIPECIFEATTKEGITCHVELDSLADDEGPCVVAFVFYLKDKDNPDSDANSEDEVYVVRDKDCDIEDMDAVEAFVRKILSSEIVSF